MRASVFQRKDRAVILVLVLWILVILSLMAYSLLFQVSTETSITATRKKYLQAKALARAGVAKAIIDLRNDMIFATAEDEPSFDAEGDVWKRPEEDKDEVYLSRDEEEGYFSVRVYDEEALFNLNKFSPATMGILQQIIENIGYEEEDAKLVAAAIVDWRDVDFIPSMENSPDNNEGRAYAVVRNEDIGGETDPEEVKPVIFRNENYVSVDELLEVYGVTPELYFGPESPEAAYYRERLGDRPGDRFEISDRRRSRLEEGPPPGLRDYFTVHGSGVLNVNTAPKHVLAVFADMTGVEDGDRFGEKVIRIRRGGKDEDIDNNDAFKDRGELMSNGEIANVIQAAGATYPLGVGSTTFTIISEGVVGDVRARMEVTVFRSLAVFQRDEDFEYIDRARERREMNSGRYERRRDAQNEERIQYPFVRIVAAYED